MYIFSLVQDTILHIYNSRKSAKNGSCSVPKIRNILTDIGHLKMSDELY